MTSKAVTSGVQDIVFVPGKPILVTAGALVQTWDCSGGDVKLQATLRDESVANFVRVAAEPKARFVAAAGPIDGRSLGIRVWDLEAGAVSP
ncbi:MAG: hypothetical protein ACO3LZ_06315, partial [Candidatus Nanopelagicales bacterium]